MNLSQALILHLILPILLTTPGVASASGATDDLLKRGNELFRQGHFAQAEEVYEKVVAADAANAQATARLGEIALLGNRFKEAEEYLRKAISLLPEDKKPKKLLAEAFYRQDRFPEAASLLQRVGSEAKAKKLASFVGTTPYDIVGDAEVTHVKFVRTDPLPVIRVAVNDGDEVFFIIDTGASEVYLDPDFADQVGAVRFGSTTGSFAGGKTASVGHARIDSLRLGDFKVKNVPVLLLNTRSFAAAAGGKRVDGVIGTVLFYHFAATLDYPKGELVLRRRTSKTRAELDKLASATETHAVPFWMGSSHFIVAWGQVNDSERCLMFADTGLAGGGFLCPESTLTAAKIDISGLPSFEGMGGGGVVKVTPFKVDTLSLGDFTRRDVTGMFGGFPPSTEYDDTGFRIGGIISHAFFRPYALTFDFERMRLLLQSAR